MEANDFFDVFMKLPETPMDDPYIAALEAFRKAFGHIPPTAMIPDGFSQEEVIEAIHRCIEAGDPDILKRLNIEIDSRFVY